MKYLYDIYYDSFATVLSILCDPGLDRDTVFVPVNDYGNFFDPARMFCYLGVVPNLKCAAEALHAKDYRFASTCCDIYDRLPTRFYGDFRELMRLADWNHAEEKQYCFLLERLMHHVSSTCEFMVEFPILLPNVKEAFVRGAILSNLRFEFRGNSSDFRRNSLEFWRWTLGTMAPICRRRSGIISEVMELIGEELPSVLAKISVEYLIAADMHHLAPQYHEIEQYHKIQHQEHLESDVLTARLFEYQGQVALRRTGTRIGEPDEERNIIIQLLPVGGSTSGRFTNISISDAKRFGSPKGTYTSTVFNGWVQ